MFSSQAAEPAQIGYRMRLVFRRYRLSIMGMSLLVI
jgi:hypothetical protein